MTISVAGVLIKDSQLMLARRLPGGDMGGRWELPGGKVEPGEQPPETLKREYLEEFGMPIAVGDPCAQSFFTHAGIEHQVIAFFIEDKGKLKALADHSETGWFSLDELPPRDTIVDSDADLLTQISTFLSPGKK